jgi:hypothetical protein
MVLGLSEPWHVTKAEFVDGFESNMKLHLWLDFTRGYKYTIGSVVGTVMRPKTKREGPLISSNLVVTYTYVFHVLR